MKNKVLYMVSFLILVPCAIFSQDNLYFNRSLQEFAAKMQLSDGAPGYKINEGRITDVEGTEYLNESFKKGEIYTSENDRFTGIPMRYNAYRGEIEVKMPDSTVWSLTRNGSIMQVNLNDMVLVYRNFLSDDGEKSGYLSLIYKGKSLLFRRDYKVFMEGVPSNGIINEIPSKIVDRPKEFYIQTDAGNPKFFKTSKDLSELRGNQSQEIKLFIKREKINMKKEADLIKLITYYDKIN